MLRLLSARVQNHNSAETHTFCPAADVELGEVIAEGVDQYDRAEEGCPSGWSGWVAWAGWVIWVVPHPAAYEAFAKLDEMVAEIAASRVTVEDPDAPLSEWEKPEPALRDTRGRRWLADYEAAEELTYRRYPQVLEEGVMHRILGDGPEVRVASPVLDWLRQHVGSSDIAYSFRHLIFGSPEHGVVKLYIAFKRPQDLFAFRMALGGGGPNPI